MNSLWNRCRLHYRRLRGLEPRIAIERRCSTETHGTGYGAWTLCPEGLRADSTIYSAGVGTDISFDLSLTRRFRVAVHAFDPTPQSIEWVRAQSRELPPLFTLHPFGLAARDGEVPFQAPANPAHVSHAMVAQTDSTASIHLPVRRLASVMAELGHASLDLLKLDIEGAEYEVIDDILDSGIPIRQLLVEFHHRFPAVGRDRTERSLAKLRGAGFRIFAISETGEEISLIRD